MPELRITIGERPFTVACQEGEEHFLKSAAAMLNAEAQTLIGQIRHLTESRLLLMSGLMLADKTAALEDDLRDAQAKVAAQDKALRSSEERLADRARRLTEMQEAMLQGALPDELSDGLAELAARAEALADQIETEVTSEAG